MSFGTPHRHFRQVGSTNTVARELAEAGAPNGTVVTADEQTAGRGRQGRTWTAPPGSALLFSAIVRPLGKRHPLLPLAVPLAVCETAERLRPGAECKVKWPNDVHLEGRKLAGILIEARPQEEWAVLGIGLNLTIAEDEFPEELRDRATSLFADLSSCSYALRHKEQRRAGAGGAERGARAVGRGGHGDDPRRVARARHAARA